MRFFREIYRHTDGAPDATELCRRMRAGSWIVEADTRPPPSHRPGVMLGRRAGGFGMAVTLRSSTALELELAPALLSRMEAEGCVVARLAGLALHEVLLNAAMHGNLGVASGRSRDWSDLALRQRVLEAAVADPARAGRLVTVALGWDTKQLLVCIVDEGMGYRLPAPACDGPRRAAGIGLRIARAAGRVEIARAGRCTRLVFERLSAAGG